MDAAQAAQSTVDTHAALTNNPHSVTKAQVLAAELIVNADVKSDAAIVESKLSLDYSTSSLNSAINTLSSTISNFEWQPSVLDIELDSDNISSPSTGDRYLINGTGLNDFAGQDNKIAEWNGSSWDFTTPTTGMFVSVDDESDRLYNYGGSSWSVKYFEVTTASTGLTKVGFDVRLDDAVASNGIQVSSGAISAVVDDSTIEINASQQLALKDGGILNSHVNASASIAESKLALDYSTSGLNTAVGAAQGDATQALADAAAAQSDIDNHIADASGAHASSAISYSGSDLSGSDVDAALDDAGSRIASLESSVSKVEAVEDEKVAGEAFAAGLWAVRAYVSGETAGKYYKADNDASSNDNFYVVGLANPASPVALDGTLEVVKHGKMTVTGHGFSAGPLFLSASGAVTQTAPSADGEAVVLLGHVEDANTIEVQIVPQGVN
jgi:hypothetical protein